MSKNKVELLIDNELTTPGKSAVIATLNQLIIAHNDLVADNEAIWAEVETLRKQIDDFKPSEQPERSNLSKCEFCGRFHDDRLICPQKKENLKQLAKSIRKDMEPPMTLEQRVHHLEINRKVGR